VSADRHSPRSPGTAPGLIAGWDPRPGGRSGGARGGPVGRAGGRAGPGTRAVCQARGRERLPAHARSARSSAARRSPGRAVPGHASASVARDRAACWSRGRARPGAREPERYGGLLPPHPGACPGPDAMAHRCGGWRPRERNAGTAVRPRGAWSGDPGPVTGRAVRWRIGPVIPGRGSGIRLTVIAAAEAGAAMRRSGRRW